MGNVGATPLFDPSNPHEVSATNTFRDFTAADKFNFAPYNYILTPSERTGAFPFTSTPDDSRSPISSALSAPPNR